MKPKSKEQLINGIEQFWATVDASKCCRYINHIQKVIPKVIDCNGSAGINLFLRYKRLSFLINSLFYMCCIELPFHDIV